MKSGAQSFTNSTLNEEEGRGSSSNLHSLNVFLALMIFAACFMSGLLLLYVLRSRQHVSVTDKSFCLRVESRAGSPGRSAGGVNCCLTGVAAGVFTAYLMRMQALPSQMFGEESSCAGIKSRTLCLRL